MPPIPECAGCSFKLWPAWCLHAREGNRRKCELVHSLGRADYRAGLDRAMVGLPYGRTPAPAAPIPAAEAARLAREVNRCTVREPIRCGCSDRRATCKLDPESPDVRTFDECMACVRRSMP